jgi:hypothetical protein
MPTTQIRDLRPLRDFQVGTTDEGKTVVWLLKSTSGESFNFSFEPERSAEFALRVLRFAVRDDIAKHASPEPSISQGEYQQALPFPLTALATNFAPLSGNVVLEAALAPGVRLFFELDRSDAETFGQKLVAQGKAAQQKSRPSSQH